jgi:hypothetical protein
LAAECPGAWTEVLLAPNSATVFSEDRGTICTHEAGPVLDVRFGCRAQRCQYIGGRLRDAELVALREEDGRPLLMKALRGVRQFLEQSVPVGDVFRLPGLQSPQKHRCRLHVVAALLQPRNHLLLKGDILLYTLHQFFGPLQSEL